MLAARDRYLVSLFLLCIDICGHIFPDLGFVITLNVVQLVSWVLLVRSLSFLDRIYIYVYLFHLSARDKCEAHRNVYIVEGFDLSGPTMWSLLCIALHLFRALPKVYPYPRMLLWNAP